MPDRYHIAGPLGLAHVGARVLLIAVGLAARVSWAADHPSPRRHVCRLRYEASGFSLRVNAQVPSKPLTFRKEPNFGTREIVRGALPTDTESKKHI